MVKLPMSTQILIKATTSIVHQSCLRQDRWQTRVSCHFECCAESMVPLWPLHPCYTPRTLCKVHNTVNAFTAQLVKNKCCTLYNNKIKTCRRCSNNINKKYRDNINSNYVNSHMCSRVGCNNNNNSVSKSNKINNCTSVRKQISTCKANTIN